MSHVPEMQRFVEHLEAPGWEFGGWSGYGPTEYDSVDSHYAPDPYDRSGMIDVVSNVTPRGWQFYTKGVASA